MFSSKLFLLFMTSKWLVYFLVFSPFKVELCVMLTQTTPYMFIFSMIFFNFIQLGENFIKLIKTFLSLCLIMDFGMLFILSHMLSLSLGFVVLGIIEHIVFLLFYFKYFIFMMQILSGIFLSCILNVGSSSLSSKIMTKEMYLGWGFKELHTILPNFIFLFLYLHMFKSLFFPIYSVLKLWISVSPSKYNTCSISNYSNFDSSNTIWLPKDYEKPFDSSNTIWLPNFDPNKNYSMELYPFYFSNELIFSLYSQLLDFFYLVKAEQSMMYVGMVLSNYDDADLPMLFAAEYLLFLKVLVLSSDFTDPQSMDQVVAAWSFVDTMYSFEPWLFNPHHDSFGSFNIFDMVMHYFVGILGGCASSDIIMGVGVDPSTGTMDFQDFIGNFLLLKEMLYITEENSPSGVGFFVSTSVDFSFFALGVFLEGQDSYKEVYLDFLTFQNLQFNSVIFLNPGYSGNHLNEILYGVNFNGISLTPYKLMTFSVFDICSLYFCVLVSQSYEEYMMSSCEVFSNQGYVGNYFSGISFLFPSFFGVSELNCCLSGSLVLGDSKFIVEGGSIKKISFYLTYVLGQVVDDVYSIFTPKKDPTCKNELEYSLGGDFLYGGEYSISAIFNYLPLTEEMDMLINSLGYNFLGLKNPSFFMENKNKFSFVSFPFYYQYIFNKDTCCMSSLTSEYNLESNNLLVSLSNLYEKSGVWLLKSKADILSKVMKDLKEEISLLVEKESSDSQPDSTKKMSPENKVLNDSLYYYNEDLSKLEKEMFLYSDSMNVFKKYSNDVGFGFNLAIYTCKGLFKNSNCMCLLDNIKTCDICLSTSKEFYISNGKLLNSFNFKHTYSLPKPKFLKSSEEILTYINHYSLDLEFLVDSYNHIKEEIYPPVEDEEDVFVGEGDVCILKNFNTMSDWELDPKGLVSSTLSNKDSCNFNTKKLMSSNLNSLLILGSSNMGLLESEDINSSILNKFSFEHFLNYFLISNGESSDTFNLTVFNSNWAGKMETLKNIVSGMEVLMGFYLNESLVGGSSGPKNFTDILSFKGLEGDIITKLTEDAKELNYKYNWSQWISNFKGSKKIKSNMSSVINSESNLMSFEDSMIGGWDKNILSNCPMSIQKDKLGSFCYISLNTMSNFYISNKMLLINEINSKIKFEESFLSSVKGLVVEDCAFKKVCSSNKYKMNPVEFLYSLEKSFKEKNKYPVFTFYLKFYLDITKGDIYTTEGFYSEFWLEYTHDNKKYYFKQLINEYSNNK